MVDHLGDGVKVAWDAWSGTDGGGATITIAPFDTFHRTSKEGT